MPFSETWDCSQKAISRKWLRPYTNTVYMTIGACTARCCASATKRMRNCKQNFPTFRKKTWDQVFAFIHARFRSDRAKKADHEQWDDVGQGLWKIMQETRNGTQCSAELRRRCGL